MYVYTQLTLSLFNNLLPVIGIIWLITWQNGPWVSGTLQISEVRKREDLFDPVLNINRALHHTRPKIILM